MMRNGDSANGVRDASAWDAWRIVALVALNARVRQGEVIDNPIANLEVPPDVVVENRVFQAKRHDSDAREQPGQGGELEPAIAEEGHVPAALVATRGKSGVACLPASPAS